MKFFASYGAVSVYKSTTRSPKLVSSNTAIVVYFTII